MIRVPERSMLSINGIWRVPEQKPEVKTAKNVAFVSPETRVL